MEKPRNPNGSTGCSEYNALVGVDVVSAELGREQVQQVKALVLVLARK